MERFLGIQLGVIKAGEVNHNLTDINDLLTMVRAQGNNISVRKINGNQWQSMAIILGLHLGSNRLTYIPIISYGSIGMR